MEKANLETLNAKKTEIEQNFENVRSQAVELEKDVELMERLISTKNALRESYGKLAELKQQYDVVVAEIDKYEAEAPSEPSTPETEVVE